MKTLFTFLFLCLFTVSSFAADAFLGWDCADKTKLTEALAKSDTDVAPWMKSIYEVNVALADNPNMTFAEFKAKVIASCDKYYKPTYHSSDKTYETFANEKIAQYASCNAAGVSRAKFCPEVMKDPVLKDIGYVKTYYCLLDPKISGMTTAERRSDIVNYIKFRTVYECDKSLNIYENITADDDDDAAVVKELRKMYRAVLPKIASDEKFKKIAVRIALLAKARGTEF